MRPLLCIFPALLIAPLVQAQTVDDYNEGLVITYDASASINPYSLKWWGRSGYYYFIEESETLTEWTYFPYSVLGSDGIEGIDFDSNAKKMFFRLHFSNDPTSDLMQSDFDGDDIVNIDEFNQSTNPFSDEDLDGDGIPDDWELFWDDKFAVFPNPIRASLSKDTSLVKSLYLKNPVSPDANFTVTLQPNASSPTPFSYKSYTSEDTNAPGGSLVWSSMWNDISTTGNLLSNVSEADNAHEEVVLSFQFPFFGVYFDSIYVSSNGLITLGEGNNDSEGHAIPGVSTPNALIALFWDDLDTRETAHDGGQVFYEEGTAVDGRKFIIVQYEEVCKAGSAYPAPNTFQAILYEDGVIELCYEQIDEVQTSYTVGIEDYTASFGIQLAHDEIYLQDNFAVRLTPNTMDFVDVSPTSGTTTAGTTTVVDTTFDALELLPGTYTTDIQIAHTGAGSTPWTVPAELTVENVPTTISIVSPTEGEQFWVDEDVSIYVKGSDADFGIERVDFYINDVLVEQDTSISYAHYDWNPGGPGSFRLTAHAVDRFGTETISAPVIVTYIQDIDLDGMPDFWEYDNFWDEVSEEDLNEDGLPDQALEEEAFGDHDGDGIANITEYIQGTDPCGWTDIDNDSLPDDWEWFWFQSLTQTGSSDSDGDGQDNANEFSRGTNPVESDALTPVLWLCADQHTGGSPVDEWQDYSGLTNHAVQSVAVQQPQFIQLAYFDHPAVTFDGIDDALLVPSLSGPLTDYTVYLFVRIDDLATHTWALGDSSGNDAFLLSIAADGSVSVKTDATSQLVSASGTVKANHWQLISFSYEDGVGRLLVNGNLTEQTGMTQASGWDSLDLGKSGAIAGHVAECIIFDFALTETQLDTVDDYMESKTRMKEDTDLDGLLDTWELEQFGDLTSEDASYTPTLPSVTILTPAHNPSL